MSDNATDLTERWTCTLEVQSFNLGWLPSILRLSVAFLRLSRGIMGQYLHRGHDRFFPNPYLFNTRDNFFISFYTVTPSVAKTVLLSNLRFNNRISSPEGTSSCYVYRKT